MKKGVDKEEVLRNHTLNVLERFLRRLKSSNVNDSNIQLFHIIKNYFASKYNIRYSFTYEELEKELENRKIDSSEKQKIIDFLKNAEEYEYKKITNKKTAYERIKKIAREFKKYILKEKKPENNKEEKSKIPIFYHLLKKVRSTKKDFVKNKENLKEKKEKEKEIKIKKKEKKEIKNNENLETIYELLLEGNELLNSNLEEAKKRYQLIKNFYEKLNIEEKESVRNEILDFYNKLIERIS